MTNTNSMHDTPMDDTPLQNALPPTATNKTLRISASIATLGLIAWLVGLLIDPRQALIAYLFAYGTVATLVIGALIQIMLSHITGAHWFTAIRRTALSVASATPAVAILVLPILLGVHSLYSWATPSALSRDVYTSVLHRHAWLSVPSFAIRTVIYVAAWTAVSAILRRWSLRQDTASTDETLVTITRAQRRTSAIGIVIVGFTLTFASFDWFMSLEPMWYSTIYGVYIFAGGFLAALGLIATLTYLASRNGNVLSSVTTPEHFGALGKLLLTFVIFWGYIAFSQYFIIWIGDIPADAAWYVTRTSGSWGILAFAIVIGQFAIPFVLLLPYALKRRPAVLATIGAWIVLMHLFDIYWVIIPAIHPSGISISWLDLAALLFVGGSVTATAAWRARTRAAIPGGDPYLPNSIRYTES
jgi:hypothetical protein